MVTNQANQYQVTSVNASTDLRLRTKFASHRTRYIALKVTLIPSSPASGIMPRIFEGNLPRTGSGYRSLDSRGSLEALSKWMKTPGLAFSIQRGLASIPSRDASDKAVQYAA